MPKKPINREMPDGFEAPVRRTERSANANFVEWANEIIREKGLVLGAVVQETTAADRKQPDVVIFDAPGSNRVLCVIELKRPEFDIYDYDNLKKPAYEKAARRGATYYGVSNFRTLIWYSTERTAAGQLEEEQVIDRFELSTISDLDQLAEPVTEIVVKDGLTKFLTALYEVYTNVRVEPKQPVDEVMIWRLHEKIERLSGFYFGLIVKRYRVDKQFKQKLDLWFGDQGWNFTKSDDDFRMVARQTANLLVNKLLFYKALQAKQKLSDLTLSAVATGTTLNRLLQAFFDEVLDIDYETIYTTDFVDETAFPDDTQVIKEIVELVNYLGGRDFSKFGFDVIGRIFERLIPAERRHELGQYFTSADVTDLILGFCLRKETDTVLDPGCGAGTFLVRAYRHKKLMNDRLSHQDIIATLYGFDIAKFPAHLTTINLAVNDLSVRENYPRIFHTDFFAEKPVAVTEEPVTLGDEPVHIPKPGLVDCVVGNPPYTRQEEIARITGVQDYKRDIINAALYEDGEKLAVLSRRAGIHAYFFVHGFKFLREGGRFGFVVANSWLDVAYGAGLQEFFLKNYKIVAIIESKVERWFAAADVNTCIVILEKCADARARDENPTRFVYLKIPLRDLVPAPSDVWEEQLARRRAVDGLVKLILAHDRPYENEEMKLYAVRQKDLWAEGCDENGEYAGAKWGKYLRAPSIYYKILEKCADRLVQLKEVADVRRGFTTGANEFFYLTEEEIERWGIEKECWMHKDKKGKWVPNYLVKSPSECKYLEIKPEDLKYRVLMIHKSKKELKGTKILKYIEYGESRGFHRRPTCASRGEKWYDLGEWRFADGYWIYVINDRFTTFVSRSVLLEDCELFGIRIKKDKSVIIGALNSTLTSLFGELAGRTILGQGALKTQVYEVETILLPDPSVIQDDDVKKRIRRVFVKLKKLPALSVFEEVGANSPADVTLEGVKPERRELDRIIMGEVLGLSDEEQLEVYRAVVDLVRSRLDRAASVKGTKKKTKGIDTDRLAANVVEKLGANTLTRFVEDYLIGRDDVEEVSIPSGAPVSVANDLYEWFVEIGTGKRAVRFPCRSEVMARYIAAWVEMGGESILVPTDDDYLKEITPELVRLKDYIAEIIEDIVGGIINEKTRDRVRNASWDAVRDYYELA